MMTWPPVTLDCLGAPEMMAGYAMLLMAVWIAGWYDCEGGQCPIYARSPKLNVGVTQTTSWALTTTPPVGGVDIYWPVAVDEAGNTSEDCHD